MDIGHSGIDVQIKELSSSKLTERRLDSGNKPILRRSSVHDRRCKADDENDQLILESRGGGRLPSQDSKKSELLPNRISGKNTREA